jgi:fatty-acyl-CoA synthase
MITEFDWSARWRLYTPEQIAVKEALTGRALTYAELDLAAARLANYLKARGLQRGDRLAILAEFSLEHIVLFSVAQKTGIVLVPLNYRLAAREIDYLIGDAAPVLLVYTSKYKTLLEDAPQAQGIGWCNMEEITAAMGDEQLFAELVAVQLEENDPVFILYTSGTTGFPKGATYTHKMLVWNSLNTALRLQITGNDRTLMCMPPFHTGGWNVLTTPFLHFGATVVLLPQFEAELVMALLEREQINVFMVVPTMIKMLSESQAFEATDLSHLRYFIVGGEALPIPVIEAWNKKGVPIRQGYGLTEVGPNVTSLPQEDVIRKIGSIGFPNFYLETRLVDADGKEVKGAGTGEFWLKGDVVTPGYWKHPEATAEAITDGWFHTGDLLRRDDEGYLYVVDRLKNMFISGGENVYPAEVEKYLLTHPAISEAVVIGVVDEKWGEVGKAFIVLKTEGKLDEAQLKAYCIGELAKFKVPKSFVFVDEIPKNDSGKLDRKRLV